MGLTSEPNDQKKSGCMLNKLPKGARTGKQVCVACSTGAENQRKRVRTEEAGSRKQAEKTNANNNYLLFTYLYVYKHFLNDKSPLIF